MLSKVISSYSYHFMIWTADCIMRQQSYRVIQSKNSTMKFEFIITIKIIRRNFSLFFSMKYQWHVDEPPFRPHNMILCMCISIFTYEHTMIAPPTLPFHINERVKLVFVSSYFLFLVLSNVCMGHLSFLCAGLVRKFKIFIFLFMWQTSKALVHRKNRIVAELVNKSIFTKLFFVYWRC